MYNQHDENQQRQEDGYDPNNVAAVEEDNSAAATSDLDHALLESLFYNEMVMLETPVGGASAATAALPCLPTTEHDTAHTIVEKEILRDFGVDGGGGFFSSTATMNVSSSDQVSAPVHHHPQNLSQQNPIQNYHLPQHQLAHSSQQQQQQEQYQYQYQPQFSSTEFVPTGVNSSTNIPSTTTSMVYTDPQATATAAAAAAAMLSRGGNKLASSSTTSTTVPFTHHPLPQHPSDNDNNNSNNNNESQQGIVSVPQDRARQLVDQFATLASRLGIDLPDSVLQSLTSAAAKKDPSLLLNNSQKPEGITTTATAKKISTKILPANVKNPPPLIATVPDDNTKGQIDSDKTVVGMAPTVMELRKTAEESIAAVTRKPKDQTTTSTTTTKRIDEKRKEISPESASATEGAATATATTNSNDSKPTYSKRRKKPRLSDCETKLAQLKAENEQLKRHLQNVSNKAHKFDKEKEEAGKNIARLIHDPNAGPREMGMSVRKFSDMYSDYGVNRQQELSFHLEQLQR
jgi:hypothetical protein